MFTVFLVIQVLVTLALIGLILIQRSESDGLSGLGGGGGGNAFMTGRGAANLLTRTTAILATVFMANSLWLAILSSQHGAGSRQSIAEQIESSAPSVPAADEPAPVVPAEGASAPAEAAPPVEAPQGGTNAAPAKVPTP